MEMTEKKGPVLVANNASPEPDPKIAGWIRHHPEPCFAVDYLGEVIGWSNVLEEMTGYTQADVLGRSTGNVLLGNDEKTCIDQAILEGNSRQVSAFEVFLKNENAMRSFDLQISLNKDQSDEIIGAWIFLKDPQTQGMHSAQCQNVIGIIDQVAGGNLNARGVSENATGYEKALIDQINEMLDTITAPLIVAADAIEKVSKGIIPDFIIDDYKGGFNRLKQNLNTLLATIHGINHETHYLTEAIQDGKLETRGNAWDFEGIWKEMISGVNQTLDAVIHPVNEAQGSLQKLAEYDLCTRMYGKYKGNHAEIKNAFNKSGKALREAFVQVADSVDRVAAAEKVISENSARVAEGAGRQSQSIGEVSTEMEELNEHTSQSLDGMKKAMGLVEETVLIMTSAKHLTDDFLTTIDEIVDASRNTESVLKDINAISTETNELAQTAGREAINVEVAGRGFGVVAEQMQSLATTNKDAVKAIENILKVYNQQSDIDNSQTDRHADMEEKFDDILRDVSSVASKTDLLALNAAIEAAQVTEAGKGFERVTEQIMQLAKRAEDAARHTETLVSKSVEKANEGKISSQDISKQLEHVVLKTEEVAGIVKGVAKSNEFEAERLSRIVSMMEQIGIVTTENTAHAKQSRQVTRSLKKETQDLSDSIGKFKIHPDETNLRSGAGPLNADPH